MFGFESLVMKPFNNYTENEAKTEQRQSAKSHWEKKSLKFSPLLSKLGNLFDRLNDLSRQKSIFNTL